MASELRRWARKETPWCIPIEWAFEWGPELVAGIGNGLLLGYLMYRSALVPPRMALSGLIGGPL